jgi:hypothetical protein
VEKGNKVARTAKMWETIKVILDDLNPEAAYFTAARGQRSAYLIVDMQDESQIPALRGAVVSRVQRERRVHTRDAARRSDACGNSDSAGGGAVPASRMHVKEKNNRKQAED